MKRKVSYHWNSGLTPVSGLLVLLLMMLAWPGTGMAATLTVDCGAGGKIQTALNAAANGDTILVTGVCTENVSVRDELTRLTLDGQGTATIHATDSGATAIQVLGRNITIRRFTITGGRSGIGVLRGGSALIDSNTIEKSGSGVVVHQNGHARIVNNTIQDNATSGITVQESSVARIGYLDVAGPVLANLVRGNAGPGVIVQRGSAATLTGNTISENQGPGVLVRAGAHADLAGNSIDGNGSDGVAVDLNSDVQLGDQGGIFDAPNETTVPNGGVGLRCTLNSTPAGILGTLTGVGGDRHFDSSCSNGPKIK
jgi:nitrous oxidase accessory protein NosD